ncbi:FtsX-like permease family protein [candidate division KSB1 bacterium]|nr:FtsX-like permease family protein [candidate division KSB1 bacterium]
MGQFLDTFKEVFHYLRQYKSRTFMTMFGIVWGTMTVILLLAFGVGVKRSMSKNMHGIGESIVIVWPGRTSKPFAGYGRDRAIRLTDEDTEMLRREIDGIKNISQEYSKWGVPVHLGDKINQPNISGIIPEYGPMRNIMPQPGGRWINNLDINDRRRVVFLGNRLKDFLFGEQVDAVGKHVYIGDIPFLVVGVLKKKTQNSSYRQRDRDRAFIPASTFAAIFGHRYISNFIYTMEDPRQNKAVEKRVFEVLGKKYKFDPTDTETLWIWDTTEADKFLFYFSLGFNIFMGLIGVITLVVGGIGLANIMYVVVQERTREIGIRRSIGAKRWHIMRQFIFESFIIIGISAILGFALAVLLIQIISLFPIEDIVGHPVLSIPVALISASILAIIGFLAGFFPARKASRLEVVDCLRY